MWTFCWTITKEEMFLKELIPHQCLRIAITTLTAKTDLYKKASEPIWKLGGNVEWPKVTLEDSSTWKFGEIFHNIDGTEQSRSVVSCRDMNKNTYINISFCYLVLAPSIHWSAFSTCRACMDFRFDEGAHQLFKLGNGKSWNLCETVDAMPLVGLRGSGFSFLSAAVVTAIEPDLPLLLLVAAM